MVSVDDNDGFFIETTFFEIVKEGLNSTIQIVSRLEVAIDRFIFGFGQWETKLIACQIASIGIVIGHRDILGIKRLLQVLQILDRIFYHDFIIQTILERIATVLLSKIGCVKEVLVAPLFVGCISIPEGSDIAVKDST